MKKGRDSECLDKTTKHNSMYRVFIARIDKDTFAIYGDDAHKVKSLLTFCTWFPQRKVYATNVGTFQMQINKLESNGVVVVDKQPPQPQPVQQEVFEPVQTKLF